MAVGLAPTGLCDFFLPWLDFLTDYCNRKISIIKLLNLIFGALVVFFIFAVKSDSF